MRKIGSAGKPYAYVECDIGESGELLVRGPNVFPGYWRNDQATASTLRGGWLHTGDVVERDEEGYYTIKGRLKEMFISGGENVYPAEVESALHEHPRVQDAAVVGVPDERWGEVGAAFVVTAHGSEWSEQTIRDALTARIAAFKVPRYVSFVEQLPKTVTGKVQRQELRASLTRKQP
jgi:fatty-acyl-CoA synthase